MKHHIILDVDTGKDDALALMLAVRHPDLEVRAVTCVEGNTSLEQVVANTLRVLDLVGAPSDLPVAAGARTPLVEPPRDASMFHGANGLGDLTLPEPTRTVSELHAVELLRRELLAAEEPLTLVTLAPLTNVALLLRMHPEVRDRIGRIVMMGGSASRGNATAVAEFNVWHDPEAAHVVLTSGVPVTLYGLDVFDRVVADDDVIARLRASDDAVARTAGELLAHEFVDPRTGERKPYRKIGDAGAVVALVAPELFAFETWPVQVDLAPGLGRGQTLVDRRDAAGEDLVHGLRGPWPLVDVALDVDPRAVLELFLDTVEGRT
ncbi:nucleoside hydrolase [Nocardioides marmoribigeumensis]|uniref:Pyrimidine-specific ribonucleoside hydrolase n=1 Tax=Nocardioides marmoribigeumensis TaxID=433649 RepID=A0ABU2BQ92_9ACTN|nr:nucleoside hydrolase [Nocardioides marmoribigeumensis]MDR7360804.1 pyrimidine-specific ribonucleoside hydrolase [Nocardioides marmoribigeumensis]